MQRSAPFLRTMGVLLSGSAVFFAGSVAAPALLERVGGGSVGGGALTAAVQLGFVAGTLIAVAFDLPDRVAPRHLLPALLVAGAAANAGLLAAGSVPAALALRFAVGLFAGPVYPIGMRLLATWYPSLGLRLGILLGAYTFGAGTAAMLRAADIPVAGAILGASLVAVAGAVVATRLHVGPRLPPRQRLDARAFTRAYRVPQYRWSSFAYFGHMWELFAFWGLVPFWLEAAGFTGLRGQAVLGGVYVAGAAGCVWAGLRSQRSGEARAARLALGASGLLALTSPLWSSSAGWLLVVGILAWGWMVIADSPMFSALSAAAAPRGYVGSALTIQNGIGFAVPVVPLLLVPAVADAWGWSAAFALLAVGPVAGWWFSHRLAQGQAAPQPSRPTAR